MFLVNSHNPHFSATEPRSTSKSLHAVRHTFSRSYGVNLPSSLTRVLSRALGYSPRPPESVCGTVTRVTLHAAFLGSLGSTSYAAAEALAPRFPRSCTLADAAVRFYPRRPPTVANHVPCGHMPLCGWSALLRPPSLQRFKGGAGILTCYPSPTPFGLSLGTD